MRPGFMRYVSASRIMCLISLTLAAGCSTTPRPGAPEARQGDEIVVAGQFFHTGTPVVLWMDPGGYDAYRVERRFSPLERADWGHSREGQKEVTSPNRYNMRRDGFDAEGIERVRGGGWGLGLLQQGVEHILVYFRVGGGH